MPSQITVRLNLICLAFSSQILLFDTCPEGVFLILGKNKLCSEIQQLKDTITAIREEVNNLKAQLQMMMTKQAAVSIPGSGI